MSTKALNTAKRVIAHCTKDEIDQLHHYLEARKLRIDKKDKQRKIDTVWAMLKRMEPGDKLYKNSPAVSSTGGNPINKTEQGYCFHIYRLRPRRREIYLYSEGWARQPKVGKFKASPIDIYDYELRPELSADAQLARVKLRLQVKS